MERSGEEEGAVTEGEGGGGGDERREEDEDAARSSASLFFYCCDFTLPTTTFVPFSVLFFTVVPPLRDLLVPLPLQ